MEPRISLSKRLAYGFTALALLIVGLSFAFNFMVSGKLVRDSLRRVLTGYSGAVSDAMPEQPQLEDVSKLAARHGVGIVYRRGEVQFAVDNQGVSANADDLLWPNQRKEVIRIEGSNGSSLVFVWDLLDFVTTHKPVIIGLLGCLAGIFFAGHIYLKSQLQPLMWLRQCVNQVARGHFRVRAPVVRQDEIGQVAEAFNQMAARVASMMADRERLLADVSHELRSPLARINVALELLPDHPKKPRVKEDLREMDALIEALLERERIGVRLEKKEIEPVPLKPLIENVISQFNRDPGVHFQASGEGAVVEGDVNLLGILIRNLIDNALKFSMQDSKAVEVAMKKDDGKVILTITDDGQGIPPEELERIFEPFVKLDPGRGHGCGYGLGLNLCMRIAQAHGGELFLASNGERGACATFVLRPFKENRKGSSA